jgi:chorismate dehydratase
MNLNIGRISYANTSPFFHFWPEGGRYSLKSGAPRELAIAALEGDLLAGPLPVVETWKMEDRFGPLGFWGISTKEKCWSVILLSDKPISDLDQVTIGVTRESSTSVALVETIIRQRYHHEVNIRRGLTPEDDAWLVIGDQALKFWCGPRLTRWTYVTDLAAEWWDWHHLPFVFAQWVIRRDAEPGVKGELMKILKESLDHGMNGLDAICQRQALELRLSPHILKDYLSNFFYVLLGPEEQSMQIFKELYANISREKLKVPAGI